MRTWFRELQGTHEQRLLSTSAPCSRMEEPGEAPAAIEPSLNPQPETSAVETQQRAPGKGKAKREPTKVVRSKHGEVKGAPVDHVWDPEKTLVANVMEQLAGARFTTRELFRKLDEDKSGYVSRKEWHSALRTLGVCGEDGETVSAAVMDDVFSHIDENGDEHLTVMEIDTVLRKKTETGAASSVQAARRGQKVRADVASVCDAESDKLVDLLAKNRELTIKLTKRYTGGKASFSRGGMRARAAL